MKCLKVSETFLGKKKTDKGIKNRVLGDIRNLFRQEKDKDIKDRV